MKLQRWEKAGRWRLHKEEEEDKGGKEKGGGDGRPEKRGWGEEM
jgi:hypothetical protein